MAIAPEEIDSLQLKLRVKWLKDILNLYLSEDNGVKTIRAANLKKMLRDAEADEIALTDSEAADRHRRLDPEW